jgi:DNA replication protein DnaC
MILSQFKFLNFLITNYDLHITGGGGVGKSYLIITLAKWITKILANTDPNKAKVLLLAFTGVAASLIGN